jgi:hypothetical protein
VWGLNGRAGGRVGPGGAWWARCTALSARVGHPCCAVLLLAWAPPRRPGPMPPPSRHTHTHTKPLQVMLLLDYSTCRGKQKELAPLRVGPATDADQVLRRAGAQMGVDPRWAVVWWSRGGGEGGRRCSTRVCVCGKGGLFCRGRLAAAPPPTAASGSPPPSPLHPLAADPRAQAPLPPHCA